MKHYVKGTLLASALFMGSVPALATTDLLPGEEHNVRIEGTIEPRIVSLSLPTNFSFSINPNDGNGHYFKSSDYTISTRSDVPLKVFVNTFESVQESGVYRFTDVYPSAHQNWYAISETESMRDFALGLKVVNPSEWLGDVRTSTIWAKEVQDSEQPIEIGVMPDQTGSVRLTLEAKHGLKFSKPIKPAYNISLSFEFMDDLTKTAEVAESNNTTEATE